MIELKERKVMIDKNIYSYEEVYSESLKYFNGDELATSTWISKYAMKNRNGEFVESSPKDMHNRMSEKFAYMEDKFHNDNVDKNKLSDYGKKRKPLTKEKIYDYFDHFKYIIPQGSVMSMLGNDNMIGSLSNCIVLPKIYDSYGGIMYADQQLTQLYKRRCGVGLDISTLRPNGREVSNAAGSTTGAISFMDRFSNTTREVAQNGRRGALMITIDVAHPDVENFVTIKQDISKITGANISVKLSDEFMKAVTSESDFILRFPINYDTSDIDINEIPYDESITMGIDGCSIKKIKAKKLWDSIVNCAHKSAEPGIIFWDRQHVYSTSSMYPEFENISTNPCSEIGMGNDSCRLIATNMYGCVDNPYTKDASFNFDKWYEVNYESQRLMDDLVELELEAIDRILNKVNNDPEPDHIKAIEKETWKTLYESGKRGRRTGLGFTALSDAIAAIGLKIDSDDALSMIDNICKTKCEAEFDSSIDMAIERGSFDDWDYEIDNESEFIQMMKNDMPSIYNRMMRYGRRNISISTVAPTGSLSILAQTSSGIEPVYMLSYKRRKKINPSDGVSRVDFVDNLGDSWQEFDVYHPKLKTWMEVTGETDVTKSPYYGSSAPDIDWIKRVELQSVVQKYITHSISSTINLPNDVSADMVGEIYVESWKRGLKGITVYRDGSRSGVLISNEEKKTSQKIIKTNAPKRPKTLDCDIHQLTVQGKKWLVIVGLLDGDPYEVFAFKKKSIDISSKIINGKLTKAKRGMYNLDIEGLSLENISEHFETDEQEALTRLISTSLRHGVDINFIYEQLQKAEGTIVSFSKAIARSLKTYINGDHHTDKECASCGDPEGIIFQEGCLICKSCSYSKCG